MVEMRILRVQYRRPTTVSALTAPWDTGHRPPEVVLLPDLVPVPVGVTQRVVQLPEVGQSLLPPLSYHKTVRAYTSQ